MGSEHRSSALDTGKMPAGEPLSLITICADEEFGGRLRRFVGTGNVAQVRAELQHYLSEQEDSVFIDRLSDKRPDICIIDLDRDLEKGLRTAERIRDTLSGTALFAASANSQPNVILRAMRAGCTEYLTKPVDRDQLLEALARVGGRRKDSQEILNGHILAFLGAKGGAGVTSLAIHLGALLAQRHGRKTLLVDLHADLGDVALYLKQDKYGYSFFDLADNTHRLDAELLKGFVVRHASGLDILPAPEGIEPGRHVSGESVKRTLEFLRHLYQFILVDCPPGLGGANGAVLDEAEQFYVVTTPEVPAVKNVVRYADFLGRLNYPPERLRVILNRHSKNDAISDAQIEKTLRRPIFWRIPNQYREVIKVINTGSPLMVDSRSEFMRSMNGWAEALVGQTGDAKRDKDGKGFLGLWGR